MGHKGGGFVKIKVRRRRRGWMRINGGEMEAWQYAVIEHAQCINSTHALQNDTYTGCSRINAVFCPHRWHSWVGLGESKGRLLTTAANSLTLSGNWATAWNNLIQRQMPGCP